MRFDLSYVTHYRYEPAVKAGLTAVRLRPRSAPGLIVHSAAIRTEPGRVTGWYVDGWGSTVDVVECTATHPELFVDMVATVETTYDEISTALLADESVVYRRNSARVRIEAVSALAATCGLDPAQWASVEALTAWLNWRFTYRVGETTASTSIESVVEIGMGVCQDFAHVLIAMLRGWGWCARYVSGFQFTGDEFDGRIDAAAMHAWVEVYGPNGAWVGLDPTTGLIADDRYIPIARGRDYDDVRPFRGVLRGATIQTQESRLAMLRAPQ